MRDLSRSLVFRKGIRVIECVVYRDISGIARTHVMSIFVVSEVEQEVVIVPQGRKEKKVDLSMEE